MSGFSVNELISASLLQTPNAKNFKRENFQEMSTMQALFQNEILAEARLPPTALSTDLKVTELYKNALAIINILNQEKEQTMPALDDSQMRLRHPSEVLKSLAVARHFQHNHHHQHHQQQQQLTVTKPFPTNIHNLTSPTPLNLPRDFENGQPEPREHFPIPQFNLPPSTFAFFDNALDGRVGVPFGGNEFFSGHSSPCGQFRRFRKAKRIRTAFSPSQLLRLEGAFETNHYVVGQERKKLAENLHLTETQVKVWFQNRRTKFKRLRKEDDGTADASELNPEPISSPEQEGDAAPADILNKTHEFIKEDLLNLTVDKMKMNRGQEKNAHLLFKQILREEESRMLPNQNQLKMLGFLHERNDVWQRYLQLNGQINSTNIFSYLSKGNAC